MDRAEERRVRMRGNSHAAGGEVSRKLRETLGAYALRLRPDGDGFSPVQECFPDLTVKSVMGFASRSDPAAFPLCPSTVHGTDVC